MALKAIIEGWLAQFPSREAAIKALEAGRIPCAPVLTLHEAIAHPHLRERGTVRRAKWRICGSQERQSPANSCTKTTGVPEPVSS